MRCMMRNKQKFWYALYSSRTANVDDYGNETGEGNPVYGNPVQSEANISPAMGEAAARPFGAELNYDKVIVMDKSPIDEYSVLWIDREPQLNANGTLKTDENGQVLTPWDYIVRKVARSLNSVAIAVGKVNVR